MLALFARFLRFGLLAFGGPVAQIAMLRRELVDEERWIDGARFNRLLAVYQVLPGPEAHELAVHLGMLRGGRLGGLLAGLGFMGPGFVLVVVMASVYRSIDLSAPGIAATLLGIQVAVVALVIRAVGQIGRHILVDRLTWGIAIAVGALALWAAIGMPATAPAGGVAAEPTAPGVPAMLGSGLKAGLLTFGGAYTAIPFVHADAVGGGWLTEAQFLDAIALSGILPTPLIMFAAFVGFLAGGFVGAVVMTLGIFLPAFSFALVIGDRLEAIVQRPGLHRFLELVAAGVVGLIAVTAVQLAAALGGRVPNLTGALAILVGCITLLTVWRSRVAVPATIAVAGVAGFVLFGGAG